VRLHINSFLVWQSTLIANRHLTSILCLRARVLTNFKRDDNLQALQSYTPGMTRPEKGYDLLRNPPLLDKRRGSAIIFPQLG